MTKVSRNISRNLLFKENDKDLLKYLRRNLPINNGSASGSTVDADRVERLEMELSIKDNTLNRFKEFLYSGETLTGINIWTDDSKTVQLYSQVFNYSGDTLTSIISTRISDSFSYTKTFTYLSEKLISINYA